MIVYKLLTLTTVNISRKNLKDALNNILEDLNANIEDLQTLSGQKTLLVFEELEKWKNLLIK